MTALHPLYHLGALLIGASLGSFLVVAMLRMPEDRSLWSPPSACPVCRSPIRWVDNLPVVSWLALGGRCRDCGTPIPPFYPLIELLVGLVAWLLYARFVDRHRPLDPTAIAAWAVYLGFAWLLLLATFTDLRTRIIPDEVSIYAVPVGLGAVWFLERLGHVGWMRPDWRAHTVGVLVVGGLFWLLSRGWYLVFGREGLALGDVKLLAMITAFVGPVPGAWVIVLLASLLGAAVGIVVVLVRGRQVYLPFAPSLTVASLVWVLYGDVLVERWLPSLRGLV